MVFTIHFFPVEGTEYRIPHPHAADVLFTINVKAVELDPLPEHFSDHDRFWEITISTTGQSMLAKIKNAAALHTPARLKGFNAHLSDFGPVYATTQTRNFACSSSEYIDILVSTEMDETVVDSLGHIIAQ